MKQREISRRYFFMSAAATAAAVAVGRTARGQEQSPNEKLNVAAIGAGGKGSSDIGACADAGENIVALCDVDWNRAAETFEKFPNATKYKDYREMLEKQKDIEAVTVSTADHSHFPAALLAMSLGKHVYVQKPMTHTVWEARELTKAAKKYGVATQMGNQGHSDEGARQVCEMVWSGAIGPVRECHIWTNRPVWPQGLARPAASETPPDTLSWDLFLGPAPERPFVATHPDSGRDCYTPFVWRGWWDFGCGALGDMGCHIMDAPNWALKLGHPTSVECIYEKGNNAEMGPVRASIRYEFPERQDMPALTLYWHDGGIVPWMPGSLWPRPEDVPAEEVIGDGNRNGSLFVGDSGYITCGEYGGNPRLLPLTKMDDYKMPDPWLPRIEFEDDKHCRDWLTACKGGRPACSNFEYAGPFTEVVNLGNVAVRAGEKILWDGENLQVTNIPDANRFVNKEYRSGWLVQA